MNLPEDAYSTVTIEAMAKAIHRLHHGLGQTGVSWKYYRVDAIVALEAAVENPPAWWVAKNRPGTSSSDVTAIWSPIRNRKLWKRIFWLALGKEGEDQW